MAVHRLVDLVRQAREKSAFYREVYRQLPSVLSENLEVSDLPVVEQSAFWKANQLLPGFGQNQLLTGLPTDGMIFKSGGTTGNPKFSVYTRDEWKTFTQAFGRGLNQGGLRAGDRVANLFYAGELYASFLFIHDSLANAPEGALNFPIAGATSSALIAKTLEEFAIDTLAGLPTTILAFQDYVKQTGKKFPQIRRILFGGESFYGDQRRALETTFVGVQITSIGYASVDAGPLGYVDPSCGVNEHRVFSGQTILEIVDEENGAPITEPGVPGKILVTNLTRLLMPIIRYPAGDRAQWVEQAGTPDRKFLLLGRSEEAARVGPASVYYDDIQLLLAPFQEKLGIRGFQLAVDHLDGKDRLTLRVAIGKQASNVPALAPFELLIQDSLDNSRPMLRELMNENKIHPLRIEWLEMRELAINARTGKMKRVLDLRGGGS